MRPGSAGSCTTHTRVSEHSTQVTLLRLRRCSIAKLERPNSTVVSTVTSSPKRVGRTRARFVRPPRFGDDVTVETTVEFGRSSFAIEHRLSLNSVTCVECSETRVWVVHDPADPGRIKSHPIPDAVRAKFRA